MDKAFVLFSPKNHLSLETNNHSLSHFSIIPLISIRSIKSHTSNQLSHIPIELKSHIHNLNPNKKRTTRKNIIEIHSFSILAPKSKNEKQKTSDRERMKTNEPRQPERRSKTF